MNEIRPGQTVRVRTARGTWVEQIAATRVQPGDDFDVVLVCDADEWLAAMREERKPNSLPWPAEAVESLKATEAVHGVA